MSVLRNYTLSTDITRFVSLSVTSTPAQIVSTALDGTTYIQTIGEPTVIYRVEAYVQMNGRTLLDEAWQDTAIMQVIVASGTYFGRITGMKYEERLAGGWYKAVVTLAREEI